MADEPVEGPGVQGGGAGAGGTTVAASALDTTPGVLFNVKLVAGTNVALTLLNPGGDEQVEINASSGGTPGGSDTQVQFNDAGVFGGDSAFTFTKANGHVGIGTAPSGASQLFVLAPAAMGGIVAKVVTNSQDVLQLQGSAISIMTVQGDGETFIAGPVSVGIVNANVQDAGLEVSDFFFGGPGAEIFISNSGATLNANERIGQLGFFKQDSGGPGTGVTGGVTMFGAAVVDTGSYLILSTASNTTLDIERMRIDEAGAITIADLATGGIDEMVTADTNGVLATQAIPTGGGAPGGSGTELQFRVDGTTFGGITGTSFVGSNITLGANELNLGDQFLVDQQGLTLQSAGTSSIISTDDTALTLSVATADAGNLLTISSASDLGVLVHAIGGGDIELRQGSSDNVVITLGDNLGASIFRVNDSLGVTQFMTDSNGVSTAVGVLGVLASGAGTQIGSAAPLRVTGSTAIIGLTQTGATVDEGNWNIRASGDVLSLRTVNDANSTEETFLQVARTGIVVNSIQSVAQFAIGPGTSGTAALFVQKPANASGAGSIVDVRRDSASNTGTASDIIVQDLRAAPVTTAGATGGALLKLTSLATSNLAALQFISCARSGTEFFRVNGLGDVTGTTFNGIALTTGGAGTLFLADDGVYKAAGGGGTPGGVDTNMQFNNAGSFGGAADILYTTGNLSFTDGTQANFGTGGDMVIFHSGVSATIQNTFGDLLIFNSSVSAGINNRLGTATSATNWRVETNGAAPIIRASGDGDVEIFTKLSLGDNVIANFGTSDDMEIFFDSTNAIIRTAEGNLFLNNTNITGVIVNRLGTATSATSFIVESSSGTDLLTVDGTGVVTIAATAGSLLLPDLVELNLGTGSDAFLRYTGSVTQLQSNSGDIFITAADATGASLFVDLKAGAGSGFRVRNSSFAQLLLVDAITTDTIIGSLTAPADSKLHVFEATAGVVTADTSTVITAESSGDASISILTPDANFSALYFGTVSDNMEAGFEYNNATTNGMDFIVAGNDRMRLFSNGRLGVGATAADSRLHVQQSSAGTLTAITNTVITVENNNDCFISLLKPDASVAGIYFAEPTFGNNAASILQNTSGYPDGFEISVVDDNSALAINSAARTIIGNVGSETVTNAKLNVVTTGDDTSEIIGMESTGTNGTDLAFRAGTRDPNGNVNAKNGDVYFRVAGASSNIYVNTSATTGTTWTACI